MSSDVLRVVYMGTPDFAVPALEALIGSRHRVVGVVTNPDRPSGRGKRLTAPPVKIAAERAGIEVYQPESIKTDEAYERIGAWQPDVVVVAAYGQILRQRMLDLPRLGCINIHASLLPKYRGAAPINWAIVRGEDETGITIMQMEAGLDSGPMLLQETLPIGLEQTAQEVHDALSELGAALIVEALDGLAAGTIEAVEQDHDRSTYAPMLSRELGLIDWSRPAREVHDHIRGFNPWPGAFAFVAGDGEAIPGDDARIKFHRSRPLEGYSGAPGEVLVAMPRGGGSGTGSATGELIIACGEGAIAAVELQAPGRRAMAAGDFLNGFPLRPGMRFVGRS